VIPVDAGTSEPLPLDAPEGRGSRALVGGVAERLGWSPRASPAGAPGWRGPGGSMLSFEPGGQVEYSSPPFASVDALLADVRDVVDALAAAACSRGVLLVTRGVDPLTPSEAAPLRLTGERYARMARHFEAMGPAGHRMMCQTAAVHVNLDLGDDPFLRWHLANAMAPVLLATYANSPVYRGEETGFRSWRAEQWRRLDPRRTGVFPLSPDPVDRYLDFALEAPAFLLGDGRALPFREWLERGGAGPEDFDRHLTTLFPEVRPRGYLELRSFDALPPRWYAAVVVPVVGVLHDARATEEAFALLPEPTPERLSTSGRAGLRDEATARLARDLFRLGLEGARRLGERVVGGESLEVAEAFFAELTARGRDPGDSEEAAFATA